MREDRAMGETYEPLSPGRAQDRDFFQRTMVGWDLLYAAMVVLGGAFLVRDHQAWWLLLLGVWVSAYAGLAMPSLRRGRWRHGVAYIFIAYGCMGLLVWRDPNVLVLLFVLYPQTYALLDRLPAIVATVVLSLGYAVLLLARDGWTMRALGNEGLAGGVSLVFALIVGLFVSGIVEESHRRRRLLEDLTVAHKQLEMAERAAGAAEERERLARDIHDTLAQGFTSIVMLAQASEATLTAGDVAGVHARLDEIQTTARENLVEARSLVTAMQPAILADGSLAESLQRLVTRFGSTSGIETSISTAPTMHPHPANVNVVLIRTAQEALANVRQHAAASRVAVRLTSDVAGTVLEVDDDGRGFDAEAIAAGYGLAGMRARAAEIGARLDIKSSETGTFIRLWVP